MTQNEIAVDDRSIAVGLDAEQCWQAVANRDAASDRKFYYGVMTVSV